MEVRNKYLAMYSMLGCVRDLIDPFMEHTQDSGNTTGPTEEKALTADVQLNVNIDRNTSETRSDAGFAGLRAADKLKDLTRYMAYKPLAYRQSPYWKEGMARGLRITSDR